MWIAIAFLFSAVSGALFYNFFSNTLKYFIDFINRKYKNWIYVSASPLAGVVPVNEANQNQRIVGGSSAYEGQFPWQVGAELLVMIFFLLLMKTTTAECIFW